MTDPEDSNNHHPRQKADDDPPNSRLFVLCGRTATEEELHSAFDRFGKIEELRIVKDRDSGGSKGVAYIKYPKTSEAALAVEALNGKYLTPSSARPLKVLIATTRDQGSKREDNKEERYLRLFIVVPPSISDRELTEHFQQYGDVEHCNVVRGRVNKDGKLYAYITYNRISHAAKAFEQCDRSFKPVFAEPRRNKPGVGREQRGAGEEERYQNYDHRNSLSSSVVHSSSHHHQLAPSHRSSSHYLPPSHQLPHQSDQIHKLNIIADGSVSQDQLWRLCDFFPGLDYCNVKYESQQCYATAVYGSPDEASYACDKLHGFEYPTGYRLIVKVAGNGVGDGRLAITTKQQTRPINATTHDPRYCTAQLPPPQPLSHIDSPVAERLFLVSHSSPPPPLHTLKDVFGRYGNLIDVYFLGGKNFGYAKYSERGSAEEARKSLHGQEICGIRMKVLKAEPQDQKRGYSREDYDGGSKRARVDAGYEQW